MPKSQCLHRSSKNTFQYHLVNLLVRLWLTSLWACDRHCRKMLFGVRFPWERVRESLGGLPGPLGKVKKIRYVSLPFVVSLHSTGKISVWAFSICDCRHSRVVPTTKFLSPDSVSLFFEYPMFVNLWSIRESNVCDHHPHSQVWWDQRTAP